MKKLSVFLAVVLVGIVSTFAISPLLLSPKSAKASYYTSIDIELDNSFMGVVFIGVGSTNLSIDTPGNTIFYIETLNATTGLPEQIYRFVYESYNPSSDSFVVALEVNGGTVSNPSWVSFSFGSVPSGSIFYAYVVDNPNYPVDSERIYYGYIEVLYSSDSPFVTYAEHSIDDIFIRDRALKSYLRFDFGYESSRVFDYISYVRRSYSMFLTEDLGNILPIFKRTSIVDIYDKGFKAGSYYAYNPGYSAGYTAGQADVNVLTSAIPTLFGSVSSFFIEVLGGVTLFGISLWDLFLLVVAVGGVAILIKFII